MTKTTHSTTSATINSIGGVPRHACACKWINLLDPMKEGVTISIFKRQNWTYHQKVMIILVITVVAAAAGVWLIQHNTSQVINEMAMNHMRHKRSGTASRRVSRRGERKF
jgi:hypothetical protein